MKDATVPSHSVEMEIDSNPAAQRTSRKHMRSSDEDDDVSDWSSDISGRFDDATEEPELEDYRSSSAKSVKRRRSNDWPLPEEAADYGNHDRRNARNGPGTGGFAYAYRSSPRASPRTSLASLRGRHGGGSTNSPRTRLGRRSRFVEATMSDSISEKPPSIFMQDTKPVGPRQRQSGIFRFGKAIASAFNPFGGWGKSAAESANPQPPKDALTQAEEAYAELKKAGYKGTNKGAYLQSENNTNTRCAVDPSHADQTWQAIQAKMNHETTMAGTNSQLGDRVEIPTPSRSASKSSKRSSFQDLRSRGLPFIRHHDPSSTASIHQERTSEESIENSGLRKQKSRKELSRQTKLLKKVSNLEEKLERARRELRQLSGNEERLPSTTPDRKSTSIDMDPSSYPRKFVPGALPTLPSERLLDQHAVNAVIPESPEASTTELTALPSVEGRASPSLEAPRTSTSQSPSKRPQEVRSSSISKESSSRKRKSPVPEQIDSRHPKPHESSVANRIDVKVDRNNDRPPEHIDDLSDFGLLSPPRQAKWQKFEAGDSPGSIERKRKVDLIAREVPGSMHKRSPSVKPRKFSPAISRSPRSKAVRAPSPLRMKRGISKTRPESPTFAAAIPESPGAATDDILSSSPARTQTLHAFYLQSDCQLDPDRSPCSSLTKSGSGRKRRRQDSDIPPVPPLPKELLANAAKLNTSPTRNSSSAKEREGALEPQTSSVMNLQPSALEKYPWPEDIF